MPETLRDQVQSFYLSAIQMELDSQNASKVSTELIISWSTDPKDRQNCVPNRLAANISVPTSVFAVLPLSETIPELANNIKDELAKTLSYYPYQGILS